MLYKVIWFFLMLSHYRSFVSADITSSCRLENRTVVLHVCKTSPRVIIPVCVGHCLSRTRWSITRKTFITVAKACTVKESYNVTFQCQDSTHTSVTMTLPKSCSCELYSCRNRHERTRFR